MKVDISKLTRVGSKESYKVSLRRDNTPGEQNEINRLILTGELPSDVDISRNVREHFTGEYLNDVARHTLLRPVVSSQIESAGYEADYRMMVVRFNSDGSLYRYHNVPASTFSLFMEAPSKGSFLNRHIKGKFPYYRIDPVEAEGLVDKTGDVYCKAIHDLMNKIVILHRADAPYEVVQPLYDAAFGHHLLCRYIADGRTDLEKGIQEVMDLTKERGVAYPYSYVPGQRSPEIVRAEAERDEHMRGIEDTLNNLINRMLGGNKHGGFSFD